MELPIFSQLVHNLFQYINLTVYPIVLIGVILGGEIEKLNGTDMLRSINILAALLLIFELIFLLQHLSTTTPVSFSTMTYSPHLWSLVVFFIIEAILVTMALRAKMVHRLRYSILLAACILLPYLFEYLSNANREFLPSSLKIDWTSKVTQLIWYCIISTMIYFGINNWNIKRER